MNRLILILGLYFSLSVMAPPVFANLQSRFQGIDSSFMTLIRADSPYAHEKRSLYPNWAEPFLQDYLRYEVKAEGRFPSQCSYESSGLSDFSEKVAFIKNYLNKCEKELDVGYGDPFSNTYRTMMIKLDPFRHPQSRYVLFHLPNGIKVKGLLALKDSDRPRPLVILRSGIFSNVTEFLPERFLFLQLFEQSPFHFLILESSSGNEFIERNKKIAFGGFDEGMQNYQIAERLQNPREPISRYIHSVHLSGISLGGHSVFFSALLNESNQTPKQKKVFSSFLAFCPLVNFRDTFDYHQTGFFIPQALAYWFHRRIPSAQSLIVQNQDKSFLQSLMDYLTQSYAGPLTYDSRINLPVGMKNNLSQFWSLNDFWKYSKEIQTPFLIFSTQKDPLVPFPLNSGRIQNGYQGLTSSVKVIQLDRGYHCSLPGEYDWYEMSQIYQDYISSQAEGFAPEVMKIEIENPFKAVVENQYSYQIDWTEGETKVKIQFSDPARSEVRLPLPTDREGYLIPYFQSMNKQILMRFLRQRLKMEQKNDRLIVRLEY